MKENIARYIHRKHLVKTKKPTFDSLKVQSLKLLAKVIKIVRGQLIQKTVRKINEIKEERDKSNKSKATVPALENKLQRIKEIDHQMVAKFLFYQHIASNYNETDFPIESTTAPQEDKDLINNSFKSHVKVIPVLTQFDEKMQVILDELEKATSQKNTSKSDRTSLSSFTVAKAVFMESLNSENADILDESSVEGDEDEDHKKDGKKEFQSKREESKKRLNDKLSSLLHPVRPTRASSKRKAAELSPYGPQPGDKLLMYNGSSSSAITGSAFGNERSTQLQSSNNGHYPKTKTGNQSGSYHSSSDPRMRNEEGVKQQQRSLPSSSSSSAFDTKSSSKASKPRSTVSRPGDTQLPDQLHPSWAAKRSKEQTGLINIQVNKTASNKIVFDD